MAMPPETEVGTAIFTDYEVEQMDELSLAMWAEWNKEDDDTQVQVQQVPQHNEVEKAVGSLNATEVLTSLPEDAHSSDIVEGNEEWTGLFFEDGEAPIANHQASSTKHEATSTKKVVPSFSQEECAKYFEEQMEIAEKQFEESERSKNGHAPNTPPHFLDVSIFRDDPSPECTKTTVDAHNSAQVEQHAHQVEQHNQQVVAPHMAENPTHQIEQTVHPVQPTQLAQLLHVQEQLVRPVNTTHQVKESTVRVEKPVHPAQPAHLLKLPGQLHFPECPTQPVHPVKLVPGQLHLPECPTQQALQVQQLNLCLPQNHDQLQPVTKKWQSVAKTSARASKTVAKPALPNMFIDAQHVRASHGPQNTITDPQHGGELGITDGILAHGSNESYVIPKDQSEHGLAGLIGLTQDQVKSGMRNGKGGVRNTMVEKPESATTRNLLQYAGVQKSKPAKAKLAAPAGRVQIAEGKTRPAAVVPFARAQIVDTSYATVSSSLVPQMPYKLTEEEFTKIKEGCKVESRNFYSLRQKEYENIIKEEVKHFYVRRVSEETKKASQLIHQHALYEQQALQQAPQNAQHQHAYQTAHHSQQQLAGLNNLQEQVTQLTPCPSPMLGNQAPPYNTPQPAHMNLHYSMMQGNQATSYPSPHVSQMSPWHSTQQAGLPSSHISPIQASQVVSYQSPSTHQMAAINGPQQATMGVYQSPPQAWQPAQQGLQAQQQVFHQQPTRYYSPLPAHLQLGYPAQSGPQNHAQLVAQQHRVQQDQIQHQQVQQPGLQFQQPGLQFQQSDLEFQQNFQDNIYDSAAMFEQANDADQTDPWAVEDFNSQRH